MNGTNGGEDFIPRPLQRAAQTVYDPIWDERNLLSLDGGGIRGYWTLLVLEYLMEAIGDEERSQAKTAGVRDVDDLHSFLPENLPDNVTHYPIDRNKVKHCKQLDAQRFLPCHYFDLICGSSTGSLIAIMLARFRTTVTDCLAEYETMSKLIFGNPRWISQRNIGIVWWPKYNAKVMSTAFQEVTRRRGEIPDPDLDRRRQRMIETKLGTCSMFATTIRKRVTKNQQGQDESGSEKRLHLLRSYNHKVKPTDVDSPWDLNYGDAEPLEIWEVARAATAAPLYFDEILISSPEEEEKVYYSDGGFGHTNNPTAVGLTELKTLYMQNGRRGKIGAIVSIGTARADNVKSGKGIVKRVEEAFKKATDPETVAKLIKAHYPDHYWRLNNSKGLDIELDHWRPKRFSSNPGHKTLTLIKNNFREWAHIRDNSDMIRECAKELVRRRRLRMADAAKWERFATAADFQRSHTDCCNSQSRYECRYRFEAHFNEHANDPNKHLYERPTVTRWAYPEKPRDAPHKRAEDRVRGGKGGWHWR